MKSTDSQKTQFITYLKVIQNLCRDEGVWEWIWHHLITEFNYDQQQFFNKVSPPHEPFDAQSINSRVTIIDDFLKANFDRIQFKNPTLDFPEEIFEDLPFTGEAFFESLFQYFSQQPEGIEKLVHYLIREMVSENTYSYIDDQVIGQKRPHFDQYKEDLTAIPMIL